MPDDKLKQFANGSQSFKARNPHVFGLGAVSNQKPKPKARPALESRQEGQGQRGPVLRRRVTIITVRRRELDDDGLIGGCKGLRDAIAAHFGIDDSKKHFDFEYHQVISKTQGTLVLIEEL